MIISSSTYDSLWKTMKESQSISVILWISGKILKNFGIFQHKDLLSLPFLR